MGSSKTICNFFYNPVQMSYYSKLGNTLKRVSPKRLFQIPLLNKIKSLSVQNKTELHHNLIITARLQSLKFGFIPILPFTGQELSYRLTYFFNQSCPISEQVYLQTVNERPPPHQATMHRPTSEQDSSKSHGELGTSLEIQRTKAFWKIDKKISQCRAHSTGERAS